MVQGSTLNFNKESQAFAKALQTEHSALGDLIEELDKPAHDGVPPKLEAARKAHEAVHFQRTRTEAARGRR